MLKTVREQLEEMSAAEFRTIWNRFHRAIYHSDFEKFLLSDIVVDPINAVDPELLAKMIYAFYRDFRLIAITSGIQVPYKYIQDDVAFKCDDMYTTWDACEKFCPHYHQCQLIYKLDRINVEYETGGEYE